MITTPGEAFPSRVSASLLTAAGLEDCILPDLETYENMAAELSGNPRSLRDLRHRVTANRDSHPLFDTGHRVRQLENAFEGMWQRYLQGLTPEDFEALP
jgi:predicted O-linked N-acetylglucosamine transferase (SPINDLY family)